MSCAARSCSRASRAAVLAPKPLAVQELGAGAMHDDAAAGEPLDRLPVEGLGVLAVADERARPRLDAERPVRTRGARPFLELAQRGGGDIELAASDGRLDELGERPVEHPEVLVLAGPLSRSHRVLIAAETVGEHGPRQLGHADRPPLASRGGGLDAGVGHLQRRAFLASPGGQQQRGALPARVPGRLDDRIGLRAQDRRRGELPCVDVHRRAVEEQDRKHRERAGLASERHRPRGELIPRCVVPDLMGGGPRHQQPAQVVPGRARARTRPALA